MNKKYYEALAGRINILSNEIYAFKGLVLTMIMINILLIAAVLYTMILK